MTYLQWSYLPTHTQQPSLAFPFLLSSSANYLEWSYRPSTAVLLALLFLPSLFVYYLFITVELSTHAQEPSLVMIPFLFLCYQSYLPTHSSPPC